MSRPRRIEEIINDLIQKLPYDTEELQHLLKDLPLSYLRNIWFQHDGASPHKVLSVQQYIRDTVQQHHRVWWLRRMASTFTRPEPIVLFSVGIHQTASVCNPPPTLQELRNRIPDACASVSHAMLHKVQREVQSSVQMCNVAEGHHFEHDR
ncbi:hypothetical protein AVEN_108974-3 [Araneus ventricosus]|nr:hypothetical protein AVEN_108974-3 [Araneus ventricosus]